MCLMICWFVLGLVFEVGVDSVSMGFDILGGVFLLEGFVFEIGVLVMLLLGLGVTILDLWFLVVGLC